MTHGITKTPNVCGGSACIANTRIPVWIIEALWRQGAGDAQILASYPSLTKQDLIACHLYTTANLKEIDREIGENQSA